MSNKVIGKLCCLWSHYLDMLHQVIANLINSSKLTDLSFPFNIHHTVKIRSPQQIRILPSCCILAHTIINGRSTIRDFGIDFGSDTYLKENCYFDAYGGFIEIKGQCAFAQGTFIHGGGGVTIGSNVITGPYCCIIASNHNFESREFPIMLQGDAQIGIEIGNNVWLGAHVVILDGVVIGDNCVIGAGTTVIKSIARNTLIVDKKQQKKRRLFTDD